MCNADVALFVATANLALQYSATFFSNLIVVGPEVKYSDFNIFFAKLIS
jgi:hypothetical protein